MLIDISRVLDETTPVYPGDVKFSRTSIMSLKQGDYCNVSAIQASSHAGTHVDLPRHISNSGDPPPLAVFCGPCIVIELGERPTLPAEARVLIKGAGVVSDETVRWMIDSRAALLGVETMSVDPEGDDTLANHRSLMGAGIALLESVDLSNAPPGEYELIALPLKITDADATWVRAVLRR